MYCKNGQNNGHNYLYTIHYVTMVTVCNTFKRKQKFSFWDTAQDIAKYATPLRHFQTL